MKYYVFSADDHTFLGIMNEKCLVIKQPHQEARQYNALQYLIDQKRLGVKKLDKKIVIYPEGKTKKKQSIKLNEILRNAAYVNPR